MTEAVLVLDQSGSVVAVNKALVTLLDIADRASAMGPISEYHRFIREWRVGDDPFVPDDLQRSLEGVSIRHQRATLTTAGGTERIIEFSTTPIRDSEGAVQFAMFVA
jgi:PAS domain-containing protein